MMIKSSYKNKATSTK